MLLAATGCASSAEPPPALQPQASERDQAERLLELAELDGLFVGRAASMTRRIAIEAGDLTDTELERLVPAIQSAFDARALRSSVADFLVGESNQGEIEAVLEWMEHGAVSRVRGASAGYEPTESMRDYAMRLLTEPPEQERLDSVADYVEAQGSGTFFVLFDQALAEATTRVVTAFRPETVAFRPLRGDSLFMRLDASFQAAVVTALRDLEPVPSGLLGEAATEYRSPSGAWFVENYGLGVAQAIRSASESAVASIEAAREEAPNRGPPYGLPGDASGPPSIVRSRVTVR